METALSSERWVYIYHTARRHIPYDNKSTTRLIYMNLGMNIVSAQTWTYLLRDSWGKQLTKKFPALYGTWGFITVFTKFRQWSLDVIWARWIQFDGVFFFWGYEKDQGFRPKVGSVVELRACVAPQMLGNTWRELGSTFVSTHSASYRRRSRWAVLNLINCSFKQSKLVLLFCAYFRCGE
jgi:hypothetical protein